MECGKFKEIISAFIDGEASESEARAVEEHIGGCPRCRSLAGKLRAMDAGLGRIEGSVPPGFRDALFARMEREDLLPRRRSLFAFSLRWAAVPLAAAAALALFMLTARETQKEALGPSEAPPRIARGVPDGGDSAPARSGARPGEKRPSVSAPGAGTAGGAPASSSLDRPGVAPRDTQAPAGGSRLAASAGSGLPELSAEEREIVTYLEILEDPSTLDEPGEVDELELFEPSGRRKG